MGVRGGRRSWTLRDRAETALTALALVGFAALCSRGAAWLFLHLKD